MQTDGRQARTRMRASAYPSRAHRVAFAAISAFMCVTVVKEFDSVVFSEPAKKVYGPIRTDFGHHLIFIHSCRQPSDRR